MADATLPFTSLRLHLLELKRSVCLIVEMYISIVCSLYSYDRDQSI